MSYQREAILQRLRDLLLDRTDAGRRVTLNQAEPDDRDALPAIALYGLSESRGDFVERSPVRFVRALKVGVEIKVADPTSDGASLRMNTIAEQVERIVLRDRHLPDAGGEAMAEDVRWQSMEIVFDADSRAIVVGLALQIEVDYLYEPEDVAPEHVRRFLGVGIDYDLEGGSGVDAQDDVDLAGG